MVEELDLEDYRYLHATRRELLGLLERAGTPARPAIGALALVHDDAERRLLQRRLA